MHNSVFHWSQKVGWFEPATPPPTALSMLNKHTYIMSRLIKQFVTCYDHLCYVKSFVYSSMFLVWVVSCIYSEWYKVMCSDHLQVTLPDGGLHRRGHSTTAITLCPGLVEVIVFGGTTEDHVAGKSNRSYSRLAETTIITFGELASSNYNQLIHNFGSWFR